MDSPDTTEDWDGTHATREAKTSPVMPDKSHILLSTARYAFDSSRQPLTLQCQAPSSPMRSV